MQRFERYYFENVPYNEGKEWVILTESLLLIWRMREVRDFSHLGKCRNNFSETGVRKKRRKFVSNDVLLIYTILWSAS